MMELTKLNGRPFVLNTTLIEQVEAAPDTTITLLNGNKIVVRESISEVMDLAERFYRRTWMPAVRKGEDA
ncbi:flagellar FlbD family protein [Marinococcus halotolerans]|uniref:flagellar FlbD family protein n=1 Tax=Marinococcus halotolerans TaxID=301092 RepID=UPI0003B3A6E3|nr:flagellar FlbD family protein [Marinococcus halotolerans]